MHDAVMANYRQTDAVVMAAAVSDYRPRDISEQKIKKGAGECCLNLVANHDILKGLGILREKESPFPLLVGFAAETQDHLVEGERKLREKNLDLIAVNDVSAADSGFAADTNRITLLTRSGQQQDLPLLSKEETAHRIWDSIRNLMAE
jgi:phosphopantothenoylcysteine decarboxylase/phosphopantothenate--cysteine ligase